jgi:predicted DsbA family dithiol-disulfide isomerase
MGCHLANELLLVRGFKWSTSLGSLVKLERKSEGMAEKLRVDIWSDVVCPWCMIGKAHLERGIEQSGIEVDIYWRAFELDPNAVADCSTSMVEALAVKYRMSDADVNSMVDSMTERAADLGLEFNLRDQLPTSTLNAHRLIQAASDQDLILGGLIATRFAMGALRDGLCASDPAVLTQLAVETGMDEKEVHGVLGGDAFLDVVRADEMSAREIGATGVPFFMFNKRLGLSGAQPTEVLIQAMRQASEL